MTKIPDNAVMTIKEVARYLEVHPMTVYKFAKAGKLPAFRIGSDWRFHRRYIDAWIDRQVKANGRRKHKK